MIETKLLAPSGEARHQESYDDDEIDLREYFRTLWRYRMVIAVGTLVCAASVIAMALIAKRTYTAEVPLTVSQSKLDVGTGGPVAPPITASFRSFLENRNIAAKIVQELGLDKPPYNLSATNLFGNVVTVEEVRNSTILVVKAELDDPNMVARVANRVAEMAVETGRRVSQQEALQSREDIKLQLDGARERMEQAETALSRFRNESQVELLRKDVEALLGKRGTLLPLLVQIEVEKARLAKAEQELAARERIDTVKRSIDSDPAMMETARKATGQTSDLLGLQMRNELINPVYQNLDAQIATTGATLAALEREKQQVVDVRKLDAAQSPQLTRLYQIETELSTLELQRDLARRVYLGAATAYETARVQVAGRSAQLQVIEPALPPDRPEPRHLLRRTLIGLIVGLMVSAAAVLVYDAFSTHASV